MNSIGVLLGNLLQDAFMQTNVDERI